MRFVVITERLADVIHFPAAIDAWRVVALDPTTTHRHHGYAPVWVAAPVARIGGVAVVVGEEALDGVPDPLRILVTTGRGARGVVDGILTVRRAVLPVVVELGEQPTVRRVPTP